jgi:hypothetical protein
MASKYEAFDGQVTFHCTFQTLESLIVGDAIDMAIPEHTDYEQNKWQGIAYSRFRALTSNTHDITFKLKKNADDDLLALQAYWKEWQHSEDYSAMWPAFRVGVTLDVQSEWTHGTNAAVPARLRAPPDLQPTAPGDEELDPNELTPETAT